MNTNGIAGLKSLVEAQNGLCVSIFLPTYRGGAEVQQNRIRFKQLIQKAKVLLVQKGQQSVQADDFLSPLKSLLDDEMFWQHPTESLAVFLNADSYLHYRLPLDFQEQVMVDRRFLIRPLLPLLVNNRKFYILAISGNALRLLKGSILGMEELSVSTLPRDCQDANRFNDPERQLQLHTQTPRIPGERAAAIFHGHGAGVDDQKTDLQEYCRQVDRGLHPVLKNETSPLIVASVEALFSIYVKMNTYPHLMEEAIPGNPELLSNVELRNRAWRIVASQYASEARKLLARYVDLAGTDLVTNNIEDVLNAARQGRIWHLLINGDRPWWGQYTEETGRVESHEIPQAPDTEIVNLAILESLKKGSEVRELNPPVPQYPAVLAIYRY